MLRRGLGVLVAMAMVGLRPAIAGGEAPVPVLDVQGSGNAQTGVLKGKAGTWTVTYTWSCQQEAAFLVIPSGEAWFFGLALTGSESRTYAKGPLSFDVHGTGCAWEIVVTQ